MIVLIIARDYIHIFYTKRNKISIGNLIIFTTKSTFFAYLLCKIHILIKYFLCKGKICKSISTKNEQKFDICEKVWYIVLGKQNLLGEKAMRNTDIKLEEVFEFIKKSREKTGYAPSVRDIRDAVGIKSTSTVHAYIERLIKDGRLIKDDGKSRSLRVGTDDADDAGGTLKVPLLGKVAAGVPITAVENRDGFVEFAPTRTGVRNDELFALKIQGESMIEAGIMDGDYIIVKSTPVAENGKIVVALIDDEATCKRLFVEDGHIRLQPENSAMEPIIVDEVRILGEVIACVRHYF